MSYGNRNFSYMLDFASRAAQDPKREVSVTPHTQSHFTQSPLTLAPLSPSLPPSCKPTPLPPSCPPSFPFHITSSDSLPPILSYVDLLPSGPASLSPTFPPPHLFALLSPPFRLCFSARQRIGRVPARAALSPPQRCREPQSAFRPTPHHPAHMHPCVLPWRTPTLPLSPSLCSARVQYDIDVPLFLPLYANRRARDLRLLAARELASSSSSSSALAPAPVRFAGQVDFSSGWEWGYWVQDVAVAEAAWDPRAAAPSDLNATRLHLQPLARVFSAAAPSQVAASAVAGHGRSRQTRTTSPTLPPPLPPPTGPPLGPLVVDVLLRLMDEQRRLFICGTPSSSPTPLGEAGAGRDTDGSAERVGSSGEAPYRCPRDTVLVNGHAYMQGWDSMSHLEQAGYRLGLSDIFTLPDKVNLRELQQARSGGALCIWPPPHPLFSVMAARIWGSRATRWRHVAFSSLAL